MLERSIVFTVVRRTLLRGLSQAAVGTIDAIVSSISRRNDITPRLKRWRADLKGADSCDTEQGFAAVRGSRPPPATEAPQLGAGFVEQLRLDAP